MMTLDFDAAMPESSRAARDVLLLSADWQTRATILVMLKELGYGVMALPGVKWGLKALLQDRVEPRLILVDTKDDPDMSPDMVRRLRELLPELPFILLTGAFERAEYDPIRASVEVLLVRPVTVGAVVETVQQILPLDQKAGRSQVAHSDQS